VSSLKPGYEISTFDMDDFTIILNRHDRDDLLRLDRMVTFPLEVADPYNWDHLGGAKN